MCTITYTCTSTYTYVDNDPRRTNEPVSPKTYSGSHRSSIQSCVGSSTTRDDRSSPVKSRCLGHAILTRIHRWSASARQLDLLAVNTYIHACHSYIYVFDLMGQTQRVRLHKLTQPRAESTTRLPKSIKRAAKSTLYFPKPTLYFPMSIKLAAKSTLYFTPTARASPSPAMGRMRMRTRTRL